MVMANSMKPNVMKCAPPCVSASVDAVDAVEVPAPDAVDREAAPPPAAVDVAVAAEEIVVARTPPLPRATARN